MHPATELRLVDEEIGLGVFATEPIPRGTVAWVLCRFDLIFAPREAAALSAAYQPIIERYAYIDADENQILCWDNGRYVNHSCDPAMLGVGRGFEVAVADIAPGDQITNDYADLGMLPGETLTFGCGAPNCRQIVSSGQVKAIRAALAENLASAIAAMGAVEQPLWLLLSADAQRQLLAIQGRGSAKGNSWQIRDANAAPRLQRTVRAASRMG